MKTKKELYINDFDLLFDFVKTASKLLDSCKFIVNDCGISIYGVRSNIARCELESNCVYCNENLTFSILELSTLVKILQTIKSIHKNDFSSVKIFIDGPFFKIESKQFKTKLNTCSDDIISKWISKKIETKLSSVFDFKTSSELIKGILSHSFIFQDQTMIRVYLGTHQDMEKNVLFATIGNKSTNLNNEITLKLGYITYGDLADREIIIDLERLNLFNCINSDEINISLMNMNVLVSSIKIIGKNNSFFKLNIYNTILKN